MGKDAKATIDSTETSIIFNIRIFLLIIAAILFFILNKAITSKAWAIISNIIKPKITNLLKNLYKSYSKLIPRKIECVIKNNADAIPKNKKR